MYQKYHRHGGLRVGLLLAALCWVSGLTSMGIASDDSPKPPKEPKEANRANYRYPDGVKNTEEPEAEPINATKALNGMTLPDGFDISLFASEPAVAQPVAMTLDDRGRLWVAECYTYEGSGGPWDSPVNDRILILEDSDHDGKFDKRTVFWDGAKNLTSIEVGFGGVWACSTPELIFIPDRDGDDVPDGKPKVLLNGWNDGGIGHCVFNGLEWGPDGWLYGTQGIQGTSRVGKPGTSKEERVPFKGGVWRYHPTKEIFEIVCRGTTNPWGLDFDEHGQAFFTNCVIGHLWHVIPGAHYKRMYGEDFTANTYELIQATSDHRHFAGDDWQASRGGRGPHDAAGGGHAHVGAMIYLGDNWPDSYRGSIFMHNLHGNRINHDRLKRRGSGYVGQHAPDFLQAKDPWFRGISLLYGPDGGVFISDWSDTGECHDNDGVHRKSGRIYKITYGGPEPVRYDDIGALPDKKLVSLQFHENEWFVRHARRVLQERAARGKPMRSVHKALEKVLNRPANATKHLRAIWALNVTGGLSTADKLSLLDHDNEHVRSWGVRLLVEERDPPQRAIKRFQTMAAEDPSPLVRLFLASALQRIPHVDRWPVASKLAQHGKDASDPNLPLMIWYGIEPAVAENPERAVKLAQSTKIPKIRKFVARRLAEKK